LSVGLRGRSGTIDQTLAAFLATAVKSRCDIIVTGCVGCTDPLACAGKV
jgi:hypothetical protein